MAKQKPIINVVFVGHVDHGKSTTIGRLMFDSGKVSPEEMEKLKAEAQKHGKVGFEFEKREPKEKVTEKTAQAKSNKKATPSVKKKT